MSKSKKHSVLIVDDERSNIIELTEILSAEYEIFVVRDSRETLQTAERKVPDVILLDVIMPEMDGYEVIEALKRSEKTRDIPVIFITGLDSIDAEEKGFALGAADYVPKPFHSSIVKIRVKNQINILERLRQQELMVQISHCYYSGSDSVFTDTLRMVGEFMDIAQVLLYIFDDEEASLICQSEWIDPELNLETRIGDKLELNEMMNNVINGLLVSNKKDLCLHSNDPLFKEAMKPYRKNFQNYITTPIFIKGKITAILDFSREDDGRNWEDSEINLAVLVAGVFSGILERSAMERQYSIVEHTSQLVLYVTKDAEVEHVNRAVMSVTGYTENEIVANGLGVIISEKALTELKEIYIPKAMNGESVQYELEIKRKDGVIRILMISIVQAGDDLGIIASDLTEIRMLESKLQSALKDAENNRDIAERSSHAKSEFLSRMSYEMLTPMNIILGMTQVIEKVGINDKTNSYIKNIDTASKNLVMMMHNILNISEGGSTFLPSEERFSFTEMIESIKERISPDLSMKKQALILDISESIPNALTGDVKRITQVIIHFLSNAIKFSPDESEIRLAAFIHDENDEKMTLMFEVIDNGIGISEDQQSKLFDLFEQVDGGKTRNYGGIGIGLPLSKQIVELLGGCILVESEPDKGSKFSFTCEVKK